MGRPALSLGPRRRARLLRRCVPGSRGLSAQPRALSSQGRCWAHRTEAEHARAAGQRPPGWLHRDSSRQKASWRQAQGAPRHRTSWGVWERWQARASVPRHPLLLLGADAPHDGGAKSVSSPRVPPDPRVPAAPLGSGPGVGRSRRPQTPATARIRAAPAAWRARQIPQAGARPARPPRVPASGHEVSSVPCASDWRPVRRGTAEGSVSPREQLPRRAAPLLAGSLKVVANGTEAPARSEGRGARPSAVPGRSGAADFASSPDGSRAPLPTRPSPGQRAWATFPASRQAPLSGTGPARAPPGRLATTKRPPAQASAREVGALSSEPGRRPYRQCPGAARHGAPLAARARTPAPSAAQPTARSPAAAPPLLPTASDPGL